MFEEFRDDQKKFMKQLTDLKLSSVAPEKVEKERHDADSASRKGQSDRNDAENRAIGDETFAWFFIILIA